MGIGSARNNELEPFGEVADPRERAVMLDEGLAQLTRYWSGDFQPVPVQQPRIPVWVAAEWPHRRPVRRAARWDGLFPTRVPSPADYAELLAEIRADRADRAGPASEPFDMVVGLEPGEDPKPWAEAGATWMLTNFTYTPALAQVREIDRGRPAPLSAYPPRVGRQLAAADTGRGLRFELPACSGQGFLTAIRDLPREPRPSTATG